MNPERWKQVKGLLDQAIELDPAERPAFFDRACNGDSELKREVESLLSSHEDAGTAFLKTPAVDLSATFAPGPVRVGRRIGTYDILEEIGRGAWARLSCRPRRCQFTKDLAVKVVRMGFDFAFVVERFRHERQILAGLDHPNIARLLDGGTTEDGVPYLVMELVSGTPIDQYCNAHRLFIKETRAVSERVRCCALRA
jgi:hypothetical protein